MATPKDPYQNTNRGLEYPVTKMNFLVAIGTGEDMGTAAFSQVTGIDASVDMIEFRQGNSNSLAPVKIPGLVKHGNVTLRFGYTHGNTFKKWVLDCVSEQRGKVPRKDVTIELIDIRNGAPNGEKPVAFSQSDSTAIRWVLSNAWVVKYNGVELDAKTSDVAMESVEIAYEELTIPNTSEPAGGGAGGGTGGGGGAGGGAGGGT